MSVDWSTLAHHLRVTSLAMMAGWMTLLSWYSLTADFGEVARPLLWLGVILAGGGAVARWRRVPTAVIVAAQLVACAAVVVGATTGSLLPTGGNLQDFGDAVSSALETSRQHAAPVPAGIAPVHPLLLIGGALVLFAIDLCAGTLRRVPVAGLPLLAAYTLPVAVTTASVSGWIFLAAGGLFLAALFAQHNDQLARWGQGADDESSRFSVRTGAVAITGLALGSVALVLGLAVPLAVPTLNAAVFDGPGPGSRSVTVQDPMVDLRRDLQRGEDIPLMSVSSSGPRPTYVRMAALTNFTDGRWTPGDREIPEDQTATGEMPGLDGVALSLPRSSARYQVRVSPDLEATWLPTLPQITRISAGSDWRYDLSTRDFIAALEDVTTARRSYDFTAVELEYDPVSMNAAVSGAASVRSVFTELPAGFDSEIRRLAENVTADAPTRYQKMQRLQQWFRVDGGFRYDLDAVESVGDDGADLAAFLDEDGRVGYCEQFAASMAIMARVLGVPSRVAVGFLEPDSAGSNRWEFSAWDLHAWPELYFPGSGWVRFEPTPAARADGVPGYTTADPETVPESPTPSASQSSEQNPRGGQQPPEADATATDEGLLSSRWTTILLSAVGVMLVVALLLIPRWRRRSLRRTRLAGGIEDVWEELRAVTLDLGHAWPTGRSPRRTGRFLGSLLAAPTASGKRANRPPRGRRQAPEAAEALDRLVTRVERSRYGRAMDDRPVDPADAESARHDADLVAASLTSGVSARLERRAEWWPRSVVRRPWPRAQGPGSSVGTSDVQDEVASTTEELVG